MKTVLLIDDDKSFREALSHWLIDGGWRVLHAEDGEIGLQLAMEHRPDVVLCDLLMPRCNGFQVCRSLRAQKEHLPKLKIFVTTGSSYSTDRLNALESGADDYLVKPIMPTELVALLNRVAGNGSDNESLKAGPLPDISPAPTRLKFWGVRGSIPTPGAQTVFYGGNTSCVEVRADREIIILDSGSGIRPLGLALNEEFREKPMAVTLLISHTHWDHIQGFPFFGPAYNPKNQIRILGFEGARKGLENILSSQMESSYFPVSMAEMPGNISIRELKDTTFSVGQVRVQATFLNHPGICSGFRIFTSAGSICYMTDIELFQRMRLVQSGQISNQEENFARIQDERFALFAEGADVLILDAQYDAAEYKSHIGWGHSCIDDSVAFAIDAKVKRLYLFHHDPDHDDEKISRMVANAREQVAARNSDLIVEAAREGLELVLEPKPAALHSKS